MQPSKPWPRSISSGKRTAKGQNTVVIWFQQKAFGYPNRIKIASFWLRENCVKNTKGWHQPPGRQHQYLWPGLQQGDLEKLATTCLVSSRINISIMCPAFVPFFSVEQSGLCWCNCKVQPRIRASSILAWQNISQLHLILISSSFHSSRLNFSSFVTSSISVCGTFLGSRWFEALSLKYIKI